MHLLGDGPKCLLALLVLIALGIVPATLLLSATRIEEFFAEQRHPDDATTDAAAQCT
jgi:hypothetical protein